MNLQNGAFGLLAQLNKTILLPEDVNLCAKQETLLVSCFYVCARFAISYFFFVLDEAVIASEHSLLEDNDAEGAGRNKRQAGVSQSDPYGFSAAKTRCPLLLVADYRFFREMGGGSTKTTINYLVIFFIRTDLDLFSTPTDI